MWETIAALQSQEEELQKQHLFDPFTRSKVYGAVTRLRLGML
jgi:hypothetical protein